MRFVGFVLVILGALALGYQGFSHLIFETAQSVEIPLIAGGITLVSGLILLAAYGGKRD